VRLALKPHPDTPCPAVERIEVELSRLGSVLQLDYVLTGSLADIRVPAAKAPSRGHRLWEHSCFEAFVRLGEGEAYWEYNFAPSGEWAAYRLDSYRSGMREAEEGAPPTLHIRVAVNRLELRARIETGLGVEQPWAVGLSTIVEDRSGTRSFWALAHPPGEPDFHSPDCFALQLAPPPRP
jgi:hypothetical protein